jgi:hypothetical protein
MDHDIHVLLFNVDVVIDFSGPWPPNSCRAAKHCLVLDTVCSEGIFTPRGGSTAPRGCTTPAQAGPQGGGEPGEACPSAGSVGGGGNHILLGFIQDIISPFTCRTAHKKDTVSRAEQIGISPNLKHNYVNSDTQSHKGLKSIFTACV